jgi:hypothetical protein
MLIKMSLVFSLSQLISAQATDSAVKHEKCCRLRRFDSQSDTVWLFCDGFNDWSDLSTNISSNVIHPANVGVLLNVMGVRSQPMR